MTAIMESQLRLFQLGWHEAVVWKDRGWLADLSGQQAGRDRGQGGDQGTQSRHSLPHSQVSVRPVYNYLNILYTTFLLFYAKLKFFQRIVNFIKLVKNNILNQVPWDGAKVCRFWQSSAPWRWSWRLDLRPSPGTGQWEGGLRHLLCHSPVSNCWLE